MSQLVLKNILAGSGNVLAGGDNSGNVNKVTIGSNLTLSGGVLSAVGGGSGSVTSVAVSSSGDALTITGSPITSAGTINIGFAGTGAQYIKGDGTLATFPTTILQAQKLVTEVYNETGATLTKGTVVYINGGHGNLPTVTKAIATGDSTSAQTYGVVQTDITNNNNGYVVVLGSLSDLDTSAYTVGTQLYLSGTTAGTWTSTKPSAPIHLVYIGIVVRSHPTQGVVEIRIQNGYELEELHNVQITSVANGDILQYDSTTSLWKNVAGTTTNIAEGTNLYFTNARARGVLSTNVGSALSYNSTTGRFTLNAADSGTDGYLTAADWTDFDSKQASLGTGTTSQFLRGDLVWAAPAPISLDEISDVDYVGTPSTGQLLRYRIDHWENWTPTYVAAGFFSATTPLAYNSTTGVFSISQANTTTSGYLSSTDWNTFNDKQASGNYITDLTGEATASGPGSVAITLTNSAVIGKVLTGLNVTGGSVAATDSILTAFGKVQNQINGLIGGSIYKGTWDASTNTPALASSVGTAGWYYIVSVAGSTNLNGITDWQLGDWAIFNGGVWQKVDNTDSVVSVNGFTGAVSLTTDNISEGATNLYYTNARAHAAFSANPGSALTYNSSTGRFTLNAADGGVAGYVTTTDYNYWDSKQDSLGTGTTSQWLRGDLTWSTVPAPALDDLTDVTITTPSNGQLLRYQAGTWINFTPTYIVAGYLSATAPLSYNSGTGVFSISQATTSTNGYLSSTDWNTFNNKQSALTNPVTGTGTTNYITKFNGTSTIGNSIIQESSSSIGINQAPSLLFTLDIKSATTYGLNIRESAGNNSVYISANVSGYNRISSNYMTTAPYLPLSLTARETTSDLVLQTNGNVSIGTTTDAGYKLDVAGVGRFNRTGSGGDVLTVLGPNGYSNNIFLGVPGTTAEGLRLTYNSVNGSSEINNIYNASLFFKTNDTTRLTISGSGAATFASTVRVNGGELTVYNGASVMYTGVDTGNNYVYFGTNTASYGISFQASGDRMRIFPNGNVAINTTTDAGYKLDVNGTGRFASALTVTNGNIQFGTSENVLKWTSGNGVIEWGSAGTLYLRPTGAASNSLTIASTGAATFTFDNNSSGVVYKRNISGTIYELGSVKNSGSDIYYQGTGNVFINADSNSDSTGPDRNVIFGNRGVEYARITSDGNALIGTTTSVGAAISLQATSSAYSIWSINDATANYSQFYFGGTASSGYQFIRSDGRSGGWISLGTQDTERMRITSSGNVGIGTSTVSNTRADKILTVYGAYPGITLQSTGVARKWDITANYDAGGAFLEFWDETAAAARMLIHASGNILIGTSTDAGYKLDVNGTGRFSSHLYVNGTNKNLQIGNITIPTTSDNLRHVFAGSATFVGQDGAGEANVGNNYYYNSGFLRRNADFASNIRYNAGNIYLQVASSSTANSAISWNNALTVANSTYVGINTTSPGVQLHVVGSDTIFRIENTSSAVNAYAEMNFRSGTANNYIWSANQTSTAWAGASSLNIYATGALGFSAGATERMRITSAGEMLVGTTTDSGSYIIQANGSIYATAYFESSDLRLKDINKKYDSIDGISAIEFTWKDKKDELKHQGYAAQEVQKILPDSVETNKDGMMTVNYNEVHTYKIAQLEKEIIELKEIIKTLIK